MAIEYIVSGGGMPSHDREATAVTLMRIAKEVIQEMLGRRDLKVVLVNMAMENEEKGVKFLHGMETKDWDFDVSGLRGEPVRVTIPIPIKYTSCLKDWAVELRQLLKERFAAEFNL